MKLTDGSTHAERKFAKGVELTLLDELDAAVKERDRLIGCAGNAEGEFRKANAALSAAREAVEAQEAKAGRLRKAFETLHSPQDAADSAVADRMEAVSGS